VFFDACQVLGSVFPGWVFLMVKKPASFDPLPLPIDPRVLDRAGDPILDDCGESFFASQALVQGELAFRLGGLSCATLTPFAGFWFFGFFFSSAFSGAGPPGSFSTLNSWNGDFTVLTCTPSSPFPPNTMISWIMGGDSVDSNAADEQGFFTTGSGSGGGSGSGTNAVTTFGLGKIHTYDQYSTAVPTLDTTSPFMFNASTTLASNRTATGITLTLPNAAVSNLATIYGQAEAYYLYYFTSVSNQLETTYPQGSYQFYVASSQSNQLVAVNLPASLTQPSVPHISNFTAAQSVNPAQPFLLTWDPFVGAAATDFVYVVVGDWKTSELGTPGALAGTATSVTIPAGVLAANSPFTAQVGFYRAVWGSNSTYRTSAYRATVTQFNLQTVGSTAPLPVVRNPGWVGGLFGFDVSTSVGQMLTAIYTTNTSLPQAQWQTLSTTNSPGTLVRFIDPHSVTNRAGFYRVRNGS
jgi:hypothetical protein